MTTQIQEAISGIITEEMNKIAKKENLEPDFIRKQIELGKIVIFKNNKRLNTSPCAIGEGLSVKIISNIGVTSQKTSLTQELDKLRVIQQAGADVLMDVSMSDLIDETRQAILSASKLPIGSVPLYQSAKETLIEFGEISKLTKEKILSDIKKHCDDGIDFITLHCGLTKSILKQFENIKEKDKLNTISTKGGEILACWMRETQNENPYYESFDEIINIAKEYDVVLSLGSAIRPRFAANYCARLQYAEMIILGELAAKANKAGVQVMIEGLGNISIDKIQSSVQTIKELTNNAPLYTLSSLTCDTTLGYDHITSAIGASVAATYGADLICATTPASRIGNSDIIQVCEGVKTAKIAAQCANLARGNKKATENNYNMALARIEGDWEKQIELSFDKAIFEGIDIALETKKCTICGKNCTLNSKQYEENSK